MRCYGSTGDLRRGRYRAHILEGVYETKELAEAEISVQEPEIQASGAIATMVPVPVQVTVPVTAAFAEVFGPPRCSP